MGYVFDGFFLDDRLPDPVLLRNNEKTPLTPKHVKVLRLLLRRQGRTVSRDDIVSAVWSEHGTDANHYVDVAICAIRKVLGDNPRRPRYVVAVRRVGYSFADTVEVTESAVAVHALGSVSRDRPSRTGREFLIFPNAPVTRRRAYLGSWLGCGDDDRVYPVFDFVPREGLRRPLAPVALRGKDISILMRFEHRPGRARSKATPQSWWTGVVYMGCDAEGLPATVDITPYRWLFIDARFYHDRPGERLEHSIPLNVRLEDRWTTGTAGSRHSSSSWSKRPLMLTEYFAIHRLDLRRDFSWSKRAWYWNTEPADRRSILQFTVGHDRRDPPCAGTIEIRSARLMSD